MAKDLCIDYNLVLAFLVILLFFFSDKATELQNQR